MQLKKIIRRSPSKPSREFAGLLNLNFSRTELTFTRSSIDIIFPQNQACVEDEVFSYSENTTAAAVTHLYRTARTAAWQS